MLPWLKLAVPAVLLASGGTAMVVASQHDGAQAVATAGVWIDAPTSAAPIGPGDVTVYAHASSASGIDALELVVDGKVVGDDTDLERNEGLAYAQISWDAEVGYHQLQVREVGHEEIASDGMLVQVIDGAPVPEPPASTTSTTEPGETTTTEPGATTTSGPDETTTTTGPEDETTTTAIQVQPTSPTTTRPPTTTTRPPTTTTTAPSPRPTIDATSFVGTPRAYVPQCGYSLQVSARIRDASSATVIVQGTSVRVGMTRSGSTWTAQIPDGFPSSAIGDHTVTVSASSPGGTVTRDVGQIEVRQFCPKD